MSTYSINPGTVYEATKLESLSAVLTEIPDNTSRLISPKDLRDSVYTTWENIAFKPTGVSASAVEYVGIDQSTYKAKFFFGKKQLGGQDVMNNTLLNSDTDIFIFNTKTDSNLAQQDTKMSFLSGSSSAYYTVAPYISSETVVGATQAYIDFTVKNPSTTGGSLNLVSTSGYVNINGILFPTQAYNSASASDGYVLRYRSGVLRWEDISSSLNFTNIVSSSTVSITGSPVVINGYNVAFTDLTPVPTAVGSIAAGTTFSNVPVTEMIRQILYPYLSPQCSITITQSVIEADSPAGPTTVNINYEITRRSPTASLTTVVMANSGLPSGITASTSGNTTGNILYPSNGVNLPNSVESWTLTVSDGYSTATSSATVTKVFPYFYGVSTTATATASTINGSILSTLTKNVKVQGDTSVYLSGNNVCIYFAYPSSYPDLTSILDNNGYDVLSSFTKYTMSLNSPSGFWTSISYTVYIYGVTPTTTSVGVPPSYTTSVLYQFKH